ncbi:HD domain-containing protein [Ilyonectria sp. MPI-CAGE-AT-0026]|nr:HD domain-containing protein [Ilyonectria sp. MPI-CAGE-AT-0026]
MVQDIEKVALLAHPSHFDKKTGRTKDPSDLREIAKDVVILKGWAELIINAWPEFLSGIETEAVDKSGRKQQEWSVDDALESLPGLRHLIGNRTGFVVFVFIVSRIMITLRAGWIRHSVGEIEVVAEHSWMMGALCFALPEDLNVDILRCIAMAVVHDMAEALVGDITPADKVPKPEKNRREAAAMDYIAKHLPNSPVRELWNEFEEGETQESQRVQDIDKLEMMVQALYYEKENNRTKDLSEFMEAAKKVVILKPSANGIVAAWSKYRGEIGTKAVDDSVLEDQDAYYGQ